MTRALRTRILFRFTRTILIFAAGPKSEARNRIRVRIGLRYTFLSEAWVPHGRPCTTKKETLLWTKDLWVG